MALSMRESVLSASGLIDPSGEFCAFLMSLRPSSDMCCAKENASSTVTSTPAAAPAAANMASGVLPPAAAPAAAITASVAFALFSNGTARLAAPVRPVKHQCESHPRMSCVFGSRVVDECDAGASAARVGKKNMTRQKNDLSLAALAHQRISQLNITPKQSLHCERAESSLTSSQ